MYRPFTSFDGSSLYAEKEKWHKSDLFLKDDTDTYGRLIFEGFWKTKVRAESAAETWHFKEKGVFSYTLFISDNNGQVLASMKSNWSGSKATLTFVDGRELRLTTSGFWTTTYTWSDPQRGEILSVQPKGLSQKIVIGIADQKNRHVLLLAFITVYMVDARRKSAVAGTT